MGRASQDQLTRSEKVILVVVSAVGLGAAGMLIYFGVPLAMTLL